MRKIILTRRRLLRFGAAAGSAVALRGCEQFDFLGERGSRTRGLLAKANDFSYSVQRLLIRDGALAPEYSQSDIRQGQRPNGSTDPQSAEYLALKARDFADYRLRITGFVEMPKSYSLS